MEKRSYQAYRKENSRTKTENLHGNEIVTLELRNKSATDEEGTVYIFEKLLPTIWGRPRKFTLNNNKIIYFRTLSVYKRLRTMVDHGAMFALIGGEFIGSEIAAALAINHQEVMMIFQGKAIGERIFPPDLGEFLNSYY